MGNEAEKYPGYSLEENLKKALTELIVLHLLSEKECFIGELTAAIKERSQNVLTIVFPYGAIYRLQQAGYIAETAKKTAPDGRRRQYMTITDLGIVRLSQLINTYIRFSTAVADVLNIGGAQA